MGFRRLARVPRSQSRLGKPQDESMILIVSSRGSAFALLLLFSLLSGSAAESPVNPRGELTISEISERTLRLQFSRLDERGNPHPPMSSTVLVPFVSTEKLRTRELATEKEIRAGQLRVAIRPRPLTVSVHRANGQWVQELTFEDGTNQAVVFRTEAPVFGLGEGAQQFDRRG